MRYTICCLLMNISVRMKLLLASCWNINKTLKKLFCIITIGIAYNYNNLG